MSDVDALYLDAELLALTDRQTICPRSRVAPTGKPFPGLGLDPPDDDQVDTRQERCP